MIKKIRGDIMVEIQNRKAKFDYEIIDTMEAGMVLTGTEIKSLRAGKANLKDSYAIVRNGEIFLLNMNMTMVIFLIIMKQEQENYYYIKRKF